MKLTDNQATLLRNCTTAVNGPSNNLTELEGEVLFYLAMTADQNGVCELSYRFLAGRFSLSKTHIRLLIESLNQKGRLLSRLTQGDCYAHTISGLTKPLIPDWLANIVSQGVKGFIEDGLKGHWWPLAITQENAHKYLPEDLQSNEAAISKINFSGAERLLCLDLKRRAIALKNRNPQGVNWISNPVLRQETLSDLNASIPRPRRFPRLSSVAQYATHGY